VKAEEEDGYTKDLEAAFFNSTVKAKLAYVNDVLLGDEESGEDDD